MNVVDREVTIDLKNIPFNPMGKNDIKKLETFLVIYTLYRPEVLDLIKDPNEKATWVDSLAIAAAAFARYKAGIPISLIADELGRSEESIRNHISGKTKAGKLVIETYEKLKSGQMKIVLPLFSNESEEEINKLKNQIKVLEEELNKIKKEKEEMSNLINNKDNMIYNLQVELSKIKSELEKLNKEKEDIVNKYKYLQNKLLEIKKLLESV